MRPFDATVIQDAASQFARLIEIMATLRSPEGCPWDREQTQDSLKPFVLEESYEVIDAIERGDHRALCEELGDVLLEAVFVAQLETEAGHFTVAEACRAVADKLVRRHPHVFAREQGEEPLTTPRQVKARWEAIKAQERGAAGTPTTLLSGVPRSLPSLLRAHRIGQRVATVGFDWDQTGDVMAKIEEEVAELRAALDPAGAPDSAGKAHVEEELGDALFAIAQLARKLGVEPETALRKANDKFTRRFAEVEASLAAAGRSLQDATLEEMEAAWQRAKTDHEATKDTKNI